MIGAISRDIIGSAYDLKHIKSTEFDLFTDRSRFTDDTVMIIAMADSILNNKPITSTLQNYGREYPKKRYGPSFKKWLKSDNPQPYYSCGNGAAMRVCPIGFANNDSN